MEREQLVGPGVGMNGGVRALAVSGVTWYAGLLRMRAGARSITLKWTGSSWSALGRDEQLVSALAVWGSDVYAGAGSRRRAGARLITLPNGTGAVGRPGAGMNVYVWALAVSGSDVYAGAFSPRRAGRCPLMWRKRWSVRQPALIWRCRMFLYPSSLSAGQNLSVSFRVRNVGSVASPPSEARVQLTADAVLTSSDPGFIPLDVSVPGLNPGVPYDFTDAFTVPAGLLPGTYYVGVTADPDRILSQITRANDVGLSVGKLTVLGTGGPSLQVTPASRDVNSGNGLVGLLIQNLGGGTLSWSASITDAPWLHFTSANSGVVEPNGTTVVLQFDANPSTSARTGHVLVSAPGASPASQEVA